MLLDDLDISILRENFDDETIGRIAPENVYKIFNYLKENRIYFANDLFILFLDLFLLPFEQFRGSFERLKNKLGENYVMKLEGDFSLMEIMYED